jgi:hypothetical protein
VKRRKRFTADVGPYSTITYKTGNACHRGWFIIFTQRFIFNREERRRVIWILIKTLIQRVGVWNYPSSCAFFIGLLTFKTEMTGYDRYTADRQAFDRQAVAEILPGGRG